MRDIAIVLLLVLGFVSAREALAERSYQVVRGTMAAGVLAAYVQPDSSPVPPTPPKPPVPINKADKLTFVEFGAAWCPACRRLEKTLEDGSVKKALENYQVYLLDSDDNKDLATQYKVTSVPAYFLVQADGTIVARGTGYMTPANFIDWLKRR